MSVFRYERRLHTAGLELQSFALLRASDPRFTGARGVRHRALLIALSVGGFLDRLGTFFGAGSQNVLHSQLMRALPVPDSALGALGYLIEAVLGWAGSNERWRAQPWFAFSTA